MPQPTTRRWSLPIWAFFFSSCLRALEPSAEIWLDGTTWQDGFPRALALSDSTLFVGTPSKDDAGKNAGAVYVYEPKGMAWTLRQRVTAKDTDAGDGFGSALAVQGDDLVVGAYLADWQRGVANSLPVLEAGAAAWTKQAAVDHCGLVYVFHRGETEWEESALLQRPEAKARDLFGEAVAIAENRIVVGASGAGAAFVFVRQAGGWAFEARLDPPEPAKEFGKAVAISGEVIVVGAPDGDQHHGIADVFRLRAGSWVHEQRLKHPEPEMVEGMGYAVGIDGDHLLLGAPTTNDITRDPGQVIVFERRDGTWNSTGILQAAGEPTWDGFGRRLTLQGERAVVGASGSAHVFDRGAQGWTQVLRLDMGPASRRMNFGFPAAFNARYLVVGANSKKNGENAHGAAFVFSMEALP